MNSSNDLSGSSGAVERFASLYEQSSEPIFRYFLRRLAMSEAAADATADVFVVAWRRIDEVPAGEESRLWLFGVARLTLQNELRRRRRHDALGAKLRLELLANPPRAHSNRLDESVRAALNMLSDSDRELVMLTSWEGLKPGEAAQVLGIEPQVARLRLHRARARLRKILAAELPPDAKRSEADGTYEGRGAAVAPSGTKETL